MNSSNCTIATLQRSDTNPPKVSLDAAIERWKLTTATDAQPDPKPNLANTTTFVPSGDPRIELQSSLECFVQPVDLYTYWQVALPDPRDSVTWSQFLDAMRTYYQPTENLTLKNHQSDPSPKHQQKHFLHLVTESLKRQNTVNSIADMLTAQSKRQPSVTKSSLALLNRISEKKPFFGRGTYNNYDRKE